MIAHVIETRRANLGARAFLYEHLSKHQSKCANEQQNAKWRKHFGERKAAPDCAFNCKNGP
jgi:hypothetical protein